MFIQRVVTHASDTERPGLYAGLETCSRRRRESNPVKGLCRPVPSQSATSPDLRRSRYRRRVAARDGEGARQPTVYAFFASLLTSTTNTCPTSKGIRAPAAVVNVVPPSAVGRDHVVS